MQGAGAARSMGMNLGTLPTPSFISVVTNLAAASGTRVILGTTASASEFVRMNAGAAQQSWGVTLSSAASLAGKHLLGFLVNSTSSKNYIDGVLDGAGDAGNTFLDMSAAFIGRGTSGLSLGSWFGLTGNTISEIIVFNGDPTGLAGWADFVAAQKAYFGIA